MFPKLTGRQQEQSIPPEQTLQDLSGQLPTAMPQWLTDTLNYFGRGGQTEAVGPITGAPLSLYNPYTPANPTPNLTHDLMRYGAASLPMTVAGWSGPAAITARTAIPAMAQALIGPYDNPDPSVLQGGIDPKGRLTNALGKVVRGTLGGANGKLYIPHPDDVRAYAADNSLSEPRAASALRWLEWTGPETQKTYGNLSKSQPSDPERLRMRNTPAEAQKRAQKATDFLDQPAPDRWIPEDYGIFDRSLIKDAMYGHPGVEQTSFPRNVAPRTDMSYVEDMYTDPVNRDIIRRSIIRGLPLGGETFYPSSYPLHVASQEAGHAPGTFDRWIDAVSPASAKNALYPEQAIGNMLVMMNAQGIPLTKENVAKFADLYQQKFGQRLPMMGSHVEGARKVLEGGLDLTDLIRNNLVDSYKIPTYSTNKKGNFARSWTGDTHEAQGETQGSRFHPYFSEQGGFGGNEYGPAERGFGGIADELSLPWGTAQAGRWYGGGELTGLKSPRGDLLDLIERQAAYTLHEMGQSTNPADVRKYVLDLMQGGGWLAPWSLKSPMPDRRMHAPGSQGRQR